MIPAPLPPADISSPTAARHSSLCKPHTQTRNKGCVCGGRVGLGPFFLTKRQGILNTANALNPTNTKLLHSDPTSPAPTKSAPSRSATAVVWRRLQLRLQRAPMHAGAQSRRRQTSLPQPSHQQRRRWRQHQSRPSRLGARCATSSCRWRWRWLSSDACHRRPWTRRKRWLGRT